MHCHQQCFKDVADVIYLMVGPSDMNQQVGSQYKVLGDIVTCGVLDLVEISM